MKHDYIVLIVGESGSGKSKVCRWLDASYGIKELKSYTTRPKRNKDDKSHIFITDEEFNSLDNVVAYTEYNGYKYCTTKDQIERCDTYIVDPDGVRFFLEEYTGSKIPMVVYIKATEQIRRSRMKLRGHSEEAIDTRIKVDRQTFRNVDTYATCTYTNNDYAFCDMFEIVDNIYNTFFKEEDDDEYGRED